LSALSAAYFRKKLTLNDLMVGAATAKGDPAEFSFQRRFFSKHGAQKFGNSKMLLIFTTVRNESH